MFHNRERLQQRCRQEDAEALRRSGLLFCLGASARRYQTHAPTHTHTYTFRHKKTRRFRADSSRSPSVLLGAAAGEKRACFFKKIYYLFFLKMRVVVVVVGGGNKMRVPSRPPSLIHRLMAEGGRSPCWSQAACALHKIPLRKFRKRTGSRKCYLKCRKSAHMHVEKEVTIKKQENHCTQNMYRKVRKTKFMVI